MKFAALAVCITAVALGACRRETPVDSYEPMKLGVKVEQNAAK